MLAGVLTMALLWVNLVAAPLAAALAALGLGALAERSPRAALVAAVGIGVLGFRSLIFVVQGS